jgi:hypothetical protein
MLLNLQYKIYFLHNNCSYGYYSKITGDIGALNPVVP